jgi:hypothetical protein
MRKILVILMFVCVLGLFARIPAGTKSISIFDAEIGDLLAEDFEYTIEVYLGYFIIDGLEINALVGAWGTNEDLTSAVWIGLGAFYHYPLNQMLGLYGGATANSGNGIKLAIPIDLGLEIFLTKNNAIRIANRFTLNFDTGVENTDEILLGMVHYF